MTVVPHNQVLPLLRPARGQITNWYITNHVSHLSLNVSNSLEFCELPNMMEFNGEHGGVSIINNKSKQERKLMFFSLWCV